MARPSRKKRRLWALLLFAAVIIAGYYWLEMREPPETAVPVSAEADQLLVHFIDVGQGDAILLQHGDRFILVDSGPRAAEDELLDYLEERKIDRFDYLVATHPHEDHIGNLDEVLAAYSVDTVWRNDMEFDTKAWREFCTAADDYAETVTTPEQGSLIPWGDVEIRVLWPDGEIYDEANNNSIVLMVSHGRDDFLLTGDAEAPAERGVIRAGFRLDAEVLKVGHHGSYTASSPEFIDEVHADVFVISCGADNDYGFPHRETLDTLSEAGGKLLRTDQSGSVVLRSDGSGNIEIIL